MGFGGLTLDKLFVILLIALFVIGPEKLPSYAKRLGELVRSAKRMADGAKDRLRDEMGPEFDDVNWKQLDPRQYDPRRIIRDALLEDEREAQVEARKAKAAEASQARRDRVQARADAVAAGVVGTGVAGAAGAAGAAGTGGVAGADAGAGVAGAVGTGIAAVGAGGVEPGVASQVPDLIPADPAPADPAPAGVNFDDEAT